MRKRIGLATSVLGLAAAAPSVWQTVTHIRDSSYRAPEARHGAGHVQYHMAREALITLGAFGALGIGLLTEQRDRRMWAAMASITGGFVAAMWSGGPTTGTWAPNRKALTIHIASTTGLATGMWLLRPGRGE
ncbi:hypothetical protein [Sciscionella sediminilitoris]|uniref:hypothetical protein n=1 Tax=Sciscionella sediminilitoris TaxID=1445613 RepID=UPI001E28F34E|nr:hypothetical protein [Sciscionella sp. SE31]